MSIFEKKESVEEEFSEGNIPNCCCLCMHLIDTSNTTDKYLDLCTVCTWENRKFDNLDTTNIDATNIDEIIHLMSNQSRNPKKQYCDSCFFKLITQHCKKTL